MKTGRNDPCPCGSGKKYKNCCLGKQSEPSQTLYYRRLSEAHDRLVKRLLPFATRKFGKEAMDVAMDEFLLWPEEGEISESAFDRFGTLFWPWFFFNWEYDSSSNDVKLAWPEGLTVSELYAEEHRKRLDPLERILIESVNRKPYSFFEVLQVDRGKGLQLKDVLKGDSIEVQERLGSEYVHPGDLVFGRAVLVDSVGMIVGLGPTIIPPRYKPEVIQLRTELREGLSSITDDMLYEWDIEIRDLYFHLENSLHSRPQVCNTDGDPLEFHRLIYAVPSAQEAFEKLSDLCVTVDAQELLAEAKRDSAGRITHIELSWDRLGHKAILGMPNTALGRIVIDGRRLNAEVNSAQRAKTLRHEIDSRLGHRAQFKADEIQDLKSMLSEPEGRRSGKRRSDEHRKLMQHPEVRERVSEVIGRHWEGWIDQEIPALGEKTPREAVKSPDGREAVEALLKDAERDRGQDSFTAEANREGVRRARELLGLKGQ